MIGAILLLWLLAFLAVNAFVGGFALGMIIYSQTPDQSDEPAGDLWEWFIGLDDDVKQFAALQGWPIVILAYHIEKAKGRMK